MATTPIVLQAEQKRPRGNLVNWIVTVLACIFVAGMGVYYYWVTASFADLYNSLGTYISRWSATWFVIQNYRWLYPSLFGSGLVLLITKQIFVRDKRISLLCSLVAPTASILIGFAIVRILYAPIYQLGQ